MAMLRLPHKLSEDDPINVTKEDDIHDSLENGHYHGKVSEKTTLDFGTVALLVFFTVSGGPMGSEDAVSRAI